MVLTRQRNRDGTVPSYPGHGARRLGHGARRCAAAFWHVWTGVVGNVFTEATTRDGEDETRARVGGTVRWCAGHGEVTGVAMAAMARRCVEPAMSLT